MIPVHPEDQHLLGISWDGGGYVDRALPFGLCRLQKSFMAVSDSFAWALYASGIRFVLQYLDDVLLICAPNTVEASQPGSPVSG